MFCIYSPEHKAFFLFRGSSVIIECHQLIAIGNQMAIGRWNEPSHGELIWGKMQTVFLFVSSLDSEMNPVVKKVS